MIDLNRATLDELLALPEIDHAKAYDIVLWRPYLSWAELEGAPSLTHEDVDRLRASGAHVGLPSTSAWPTYSVDLARRS